MQFGPFWLNDEPANPLAIDLYSTEDLSAYTAATATLYAPDGTSVPFGTEPITDEQVVFPWPLSALTKAGVHTLEVRLTGSGYSLALDPIHVVVQDRATGWNTLSSARRVWPDAPEDDALLFELLEVSAFQCEVYCPLNEEGDVPRGHKAAQIMQARNIWSASRVSSDGGLGSEGYIIQPRPLDWVIKQLLRPNPGPLGVVG